MSDDSKILLEPQLTSWQLSGLCRVTSWTRFVLQRPEGVEESARSNIPRWVSSWAARRSSWNRQRLHKEEARVQNQVSLKRLIKSSRSSKKLFLGFQMAANSYCKRTTTPRCNSGLGRWKRNATKPAPRVDHKHCQPPRKKMNRSEDRSSPSRKSKRVWCLRLSLIILCVQHNK